jgi:hypothetical protein
MIHTEQGCGVRMRRASGRHIHGVLRCSRNREHVSYSAVARELSPANFINIGGDAAANQFRTQYDNG